MEFKKVSLIIFFLFLPFTPVLAKEASGTNDKNVLDFEGDVIEGKKATPDIFLQLDSETSSLDSLIFSRSDFNDFQKNDPRRLSIWKSDQ